MAKKSTPKPINQMSVYHSFALVYEKLMNDEIPVEKAEQASNALNGMNRAYALEIKRAELEKLHRPRAIEINDAEADKKFLAGADEVSDDTKE